MNWRTEQRIPSFAVVSRECQLIPHACLGYSTGEQRRVKRRLVASTVLVRIDAYLIGCCRIQEAAAGLRQIMFRSPCQKSADQGYTASTSTQHQAHVHDPGLHEQQSPRSNAERCWSPRGVHRASLHAPYPPAPSPGTPTANTTRATEWHRIREPLQRRTLGAMGERGVTRREG